MDTTFFLAQLWGPVIFAIGLGVFTSRSYYITIYRDLEKESLAVLLLGITFMIAGIIQVLAHNVWGSLPQVVISITSWGILIKGVMFVVIPRTVDKAGDWWVNNHALSLAGVLMLAVGGYLSWVAYFA